MTSGRAKDEEGEITITIGAKETIVDHLKIVMVVVVVVVVLMEIGHEMIPHPQEILIRLPTVLLNLKAEGMMVSVSHGKGPLFSPRSKTILGLITQAGQISNLEEMLLCKDLIIYD